MRILQYKAQRTVVITGLVAAALVANIADAAASNRHRYSGASTPKRDWVGYYAPSTPERYDRATPEWSRDNRGMFEEKLGAP